MSFTSLAFFLFLPAVFVAHWLIPKRSWQNNMLLVASYVFYGWWDWRFCFLMLGSSLVDYYAGIGLDRDLPIGLESFFCWSRKARETALERTPVKGTSSDNKKK